MMHPTWTSLIPPILVLLAAGITRNVIASLALGIVTAALIFTNFAPLDTFRTIIEAFNGAIVTDVTTLQLFAFLVLLGTITELLTHIGGIAAYTKMLLKRLATKRGVETTSLIHSKIFFLDDYLNSLVTGSIMKPLTDAFSIPRAKLAYLLNTMSSPLCVLIPASTWGALILVQLQKAGISDEPGSTVLVAADPLITYLKTIPFIFYPFLIIGTSWIIVRFSLSFGAMHKQEQIAEQTGNLYGGKPTPVQKIERTELEGSITSLIIPIATFILSVVFFVLWAGNNKLLGGTYGFVETLKHTKTTWSLLMASLVTLGVISCMLLIKRSFSFKTIGKACWNGFCLMRNSLTVLILAFTLGYLLNTYLQTGIYLAQIISTSLPLFVLPLIVFLIATVCTASTGSSWGTILLLMPLTVETLASLVQTSASLSTTDIPTFFATIGALLAGSVAGAHFSPITDATVVSSTSAGAYHMDHVKTLISYATPALIGSCCAFLASGFTYNWGVWYSYFLSISIGAMVTTLILTVRQKLTKNTPSIQAPNSVE